MYSILKSVYDNTIRTHLPRKICVRNGVAVKDIYLFDISDHKPNFKQGFVDAVANHVDNPSEVTLIAFGMGFSTSYLLDSGAEHITAYEGSREMIERGKHTLEMNQYSMNKVDVNHAIVGDAKDIWGDSEGADIISPQELPESKVLVLDCEGSEIDILDQITHSPNTIICESHPNLDASTNQIANLIEDEYEVTSYEYEPGREDNKRIIVGERN